MNTLEEDALVNVQYALYSSQAIVFIVRSWRATQSRVHRFSPLLRKCVATR